MEEILFRLENILASSNWMVLELQQKLLSLYIQRKGTSRPLKDRMIQLCQNILNYMDRVDPDNEEGPRRQGIKRCLVDSKIENLTQDYKNGTVLKDKLMKALLEKQSSFPV